MVPKYDILGTHGAPQSNQRGKESKRENLEFLKPSTNKKMRRYLGLSTYFRPFISNYINNAACLF
jgi:hypothetical protein